LLVVRAFGSELRQDSLPIDSHGERPDLADTTAKAFRGFEDHMLDDVELS
jgi:hypothetical protein